MVLEQTSKIVFFAACGLAVQMSLAQPSRLPGVTLEDFFTASIDFSPELQISKENLNISAARRKSANGQLLPQISAGANLSDNRLNEVNRFLQYDGERYSISLSQTLFDWQQFEARKQSYLVEDSQEQEYYYQLGLLLTEVAEAYFNVLQARDALDSLESELEAITNQVNQIQNLYDRQLAQITDLYQGQASLAAVQAEQLRLEIDLALTQEALRSLSGLEIGPLYQLNDSAEISPLEFSLNYYVDQSREQNHQIQSMEYRLRASQAAVSASKGAFLPKLSFIAQRQDSDVGFDNLPQNKRDNTYVGVNLTIPIYAGGRNTAAVSEATSRRSIAESELRAMQLQVRANIRSAYLQVQASESQTSAARALLESTALAAESMQQGFSLGTVTSVDVLNALRDQYRAERDLQRTRYEHVIYLLSLRRETGTLSAEDMLEVGVWLEPKPL
jgi:outer membrane protein